jgi:hypothetical protein
VAGLRASRAAIKTLEHAWPKPEQQVHVPLDDDVDLRSLSDAELQARELRQRV